LDRRQQGFNRPLGVAHLARRPRSQYARFRFRIAAPAGVRHAFYCVGFYVGRIAEARLFLEERREFAARCSPFCGLVPSGSYWAEGFTCGPGAWKASWVGWRPSVECRARRPFTAPLSSSVAALLFAPPPLTLRDLSCLDAAGSGPAWWLG
jgi:hypothetical protein